MQEQSPDWPPRGSAVGVPDGLRRCGSTGQIFEARRNQWVRVNRAETVQSFISDAELERMQKAAREHPATAHTNAGGWCIHCGCGNDILGHRHLTNCARSQ